MPSPAHAQLLRELRASLTLRKRPEDVARLLQDPYAAHGTDRDSATEAALAITRLLVRWNGFLRQVADHSGPGNDHGGDEEALRRSARL